MRRPTSGAVGLIEMLEPRIAPAGVSELVLHFVSMKFPDVAVPGDSGSMTFTIENIGDAPATNNTCINFWLVPDLLGTTPIDSVFNNGLYGYNEGNAEKIVDGLKDVPLNLAPGKTTAPITKKFTLPDMILGEDTVVPSALLFGYGGGYHPFNMTPGNHFIVAEVDGASENELPFVSNHKNNYA